MSLRIRLTVVDAGPLEVDRSDLMQGASGAVTVPSTVVVIEHSAHGLLLFDTGINFRVADPDQAEAQWGRAFGNGTAQRCSPATLRSTPASRASGTGART